MKTKTLVMQVEQIIEDGGKKKSRRKALKKVLHKLRKRQKKAEARLDAAETASDKHFYEKTVKITKRQRKKGLKAMKELR